MRGTLLPRSDISTPDFPEYLTAGGMKMRRVDGDMVNRLSKGDPILGWGGDNRLGLYVAPRGRKWCLVRWCEDRSFQVLTTAPATPGNALDVLGAFIGFLIGSDGRRGIDVAKQVSAANEKRVAEVEANLERWVEEEGAPRAAAGFLAG